MDSLEQFVKRKAREFHGAVRFDRRPYQIEIARRCFHALRRRRNVVIDLPTGAGKTNVALLISLLARWGTHKKALYVVPTRILIDQVVAAATWAAPELRRVGITDALCVNAFHLRTAVSEADIVITTPGLFASLVRRSTIPRETLNRDFGFAVIDEFDEFLLVEPSRTGFIVRFDSSFASLWEFIRPLPMLFMSGTAPVGLPKLSFSSTLKYFAKFTAEQFRPVHVAVPAKRFVRYVPTANVQLVGSDDSYVRRCEAALNYRIQSVIAEYECAHEIRLDMTYLMERLSAVTTGYLNTVRLKTGAFFRVDRELRKLCLTLLSLLNMYSFLYKDMFAGIRAKATNVKTVENCVETETWQTVQVLDDRRSDPHVLHAHLQSKAANLWSIVNAHKNEKGLILTRFVRLSDALEAFLERNGIRVLKIDARVKTDRERYALVRTFQDGPAAVVIITRGTGRRGLDIPRADYAVLYSPKDDEYVVWQELSRIRSTLLDAKPSYILYYRETTEEDRLNRLRGDMMRSSHRYQFSEGFS